MQGALWLRTLLQWMLLGAMSAAWCMALGLSHPFFGLGRIHTVLFCLVLMPVSFACLGAWLHTRGRLRVFSRSASSTTTPDTGKQALRSIAMGVLVFVAWATSYYATGLLTYQRTMMTLSLSLDGMIPFVPRIVFVYITVQVFVLWATVRAAPTIPWGAFLRTYGTILLVCNLCFLLLPVTMQWPKLDTTHIPAWVLSLVHGSDIPHNCFPSSHCAMALAAALFLFRVHRTLGWIGLAHALTIGVSTLLTKQHYVVDVLAGFALALFSYWRWGHKIQGDHGCLHYEEK